MMDMRQIEEHVTSVSNTLSRRERDIRRVKWRNNLSNFDEIFFVNNGGQFVSVGISLRFYSGVLKKSVLQRVPFQPGEKLFVFIKMQRSTDL